MKVEYSFSCKSKEAIVLNEFLFRKGQEYEMIPFPFNGTSSKQESKTPMYYGVISNDKIECYLYPTQLNPNFVIISKTTF